MELQNENASIENGHLHESIINLNSPGINNAMSFLTNKSRRYRREDYNEDDYEIVCKHSNTGRSKLIHKCIEIFCDISIYSS